MKEIVLIGMGGHARSVADAIRNCGEYRIIGYTDSNPVEQDLGYEYLGDDSVLEGLFDKGVRYAAVTVGQIEDAHVRKSLYEKLKKIGFELPLIIDPSAIISRDVFLGEGTFVGKGAIVNVNCKIGKMAILNSGSICEHDVCVGDFTHISVGAVCCGMTSIGRETFIGANATVIQCVKIGDNVVIGAGSVARHNVNNREKVYGII